MRTLRHDARLQRAAPHLAGPAGPLPFLHLAANCSDCSTDCESAIRTVSGAARALLVQLRDDDRCSSRRGVRRAGPAAPIRALAISADARARHAGTPPACAELAPAGASPCGSSFLAGAQQQGCLLTTTPPAHLSLLSPSHSSPKMRTDARECIHLCAAAAAAAHVPSPPPALRPSSDMRSPRQSATRRSTSSPSCSSRAATAMAVRCWRVICILCPVAHGLPLPLL
jgi:hypothetical protein